MPTILRCPPGRLATKTIGPTGVVKGYDAGATFTWRKVTLPHDVTALFNWLSAQVLRPDEYLVHGSVRDGAGPRVNRRIHEKEGRRPPDFRDADQRHLVIDVDGVRGDADFRSDPIAAVISIRDRIPELRGVACIFIGSSQAGMSELVRGKLVFILDRPVSLSAIKTWALVANQKAGEKIIDLSLFNPVQPIYLAAPLFVGGAIDPMPERVRIIPGEERAVVLPASEQGARPLKPANGGGAKTLANIVVSPLWEGVAVDPDDLTLGVGGNWFERLGSADKNTALEQMFSYLPDVAQGPRKRARREDPACWLECLMAAHASGAPDAEDIARRWSKLGEGHYDDNVETAFDIAWRSFSHRIAGGVTIAALIALATAHGFDAHAWWAYEKGLTPKEGRALKEARAAAAAPSVTAAAGAASAGKPSLTVAHEAEALRVAKSRLHSTFLISKLLGHHRLASDLARVCMTVRSVPVRERLMFMLAALLLNSNHPPEEIAGAVETCGFPRETAVRAVLWAKKNIAKGDRSP